MATFQRYCLFCWQECETDGIECSGCYDRCHFSCANIEPDLQTTWRESGIEYFCQSCSFQGESYDFSSSLARMRKRVCEIDFGTDGAHARLKLIAEQERLLLASHRVTHDAIQYGRKYAQPFVDETSVSILRSLSPITLDKYVPVSILEDGNCFYRAVSFAAYETQAHHIQLRLLAALEILSYPEFYDKKSRSLLPPLQNYCIVTPDLKALCVDTLTPGAYTDAASMLATGSALNLVFSSYMPSIGPDDFRSSAYTLQIKGRDVSNRCESAFVIMWTSDSFQSNKFFPNHFVPLLSLTSICEEIGDAKLNDREEITAENEIEINRATSGIPEGSCCKNRYAKYNDNRERTINDEKVKGNVSDAQKNSCLIALEVEEKYLAPGAAKLPFKHFLGIKYILKVLEGQAKDVDVFKTIPPGEKNNCYFVIDNTLNKHRQESKTKQVFEDDRGAWKKATRTSSFYVSRSDDVSYIYFREGKYCNRTRKEGYNVIEPQPQDSDVRKVGRYYGKQGNYERRITWLENGADFPCYAVVEYKGVFEGHRVHGNSKYNTHNYVRASTDTIIDSCIVFAPYRQYTLSKYSWMQTDEDAKNEFSQKSLCYGPRAHLREPASTNGMLHAIESSQNACLKIGQKRKRSVNAWSRKK